MKMFTKQQRIFAVALSVCLAVCCTTVTAETVNPIEPTQISNSASAIALKAEDLPANIQALLPKDAASDSVYLRASEKVDGAYDAAELYTLRTENHTTGEGTLTVHSVPIKYIDENGELQFIDTSIRPTASTRAGYSYQNAANRFTVEYGTAAATGVCFDDTFVFAAKTTVASTGKQTVLQTATDTVLYANAFGSNTAVEYINTENGVKENIILNKYTGQTRFDFVFRSETHVPILAADGAFIWIAHKDTPKEPEYRFLSLYAYDSYDPAVHGVQKDAQFRHMNEDLYYDLTSNDDGSYTITVVVPEEYLTHPDIVYPVTIDPSITLTSTDTNAHDTFVDASKPTAQNNYDLDYIRFGKKSGHKLFGYHRFVSLPALPNNVFVTSANLKFTFRNGQNTPTASSGVQIAFLQVQAKQWNESTITWNNQPYGILNSLANIVYDGNYLDYVNADVAAMFCDWYGGTRANYGFDFTYSNEEYDDYNSVYSSESTAAKAPVLTITYESAGLSYNQKYYLRNANSDKYLSVTSGDNGTNLTQFAFIASNHQQFKITYNQATLDYSLYSEKASHSAIEITNASSSNNEIVQIWEAPSSGVMNSQRFRIRKNSDGTYTLLSYCSNYCKAIQVENASTALGAAIVQYTNNNAANQKWYLERVEANNCSREVTAMPMSDTYENAVSTSDAQFKSMSLAEYLLESNTLISAATAARAGAMAASSVYPIAADMLLHFLDITGSTYTLPSDFIKSANPISSKRQQALNALNGAYDILKVSDITVAYGLQSIIGYAGGPLDNDWALAVNKCEIWGLTTATGTTAKQTSLQIRDLYDFATDDLSTFFGVASTLLHQCHRAGIAKNFPITGSAIY